MDRVEKTGKLLNEYNHMKNIYSSDNFTMVFPNHKEEYAPIFQLDVDKEIELLANKFRILSTPGVETIRQPVKASHVVGFKAAEEVKGIEHSYITDDTSSHFSKTLPNFERPASARIYNEPKSYFEPEMVQSQSQAQNLIQVTTPVKKKLRVIRWLTKKIGEYDIDNDFWTSADCQVKSPFLAFSRSVYLPNGDILIMGGLDDEIPNKP